MEASSAGASPPPRRQVPSYPHMTNSTGLIVEGRALLPSPSHEYALSLSLSCHHDGLLALLHAAACSALLVMSTSPHPSITMASSPSCTQRHALLSWS